MGDFSAAILSLNVWLIAAVFLGTIIAYFIFGWSNKDFIYLYIGSILYVFIL